ncbi:MAG TPA: TetR/AcrR family transcriptional regulator [Acidimicrobiia bacterium]|nr:TetR/AcrR family transcriptional regulator [Acidimicrobiia bacterium]
MSEPSRTYKSELREEQAEATRRRILEALAQVMADGVNALSAPVAQRAGVSVGTIYKTSVTRPDSSGP